MTWRQGEIIDLATSAPRDGRHIALRALTDCEVVVIDPDVLGEIGSRAPEVADAFNQVSAIRRRRLERLADRQAVDARDARARRGQSHRRDGHVTRRRGGACTAGGNDVAPASSGPDTDMNAGVAQMHVRCPGGAGRGGCDDSWRALSCSSHWHRCSLVAGLNFVAARHLLDDGTKDQLVGVGEARARSIDLGIGRVLASTSALAADLAVVESLAGARRRMRTHALEAECWTKTKRQHSMPVTCRSWSTR